MSSSIYLFIDLYKFKLVYNYFKNETNKENKFIWGYIEFESSALKDLPYICVRTSIIICHLNIK